MSYQTHFLIGAAILFPSIIVAASLTGIGQNAPQVTKYNENPVRLSSVGPCRGEDLSVRHITEDAAMGGHNTIDYALKNNSSSACTLKGYPRFELLNKSGKLISRGRAINSQQILGDETKQSPQLVTIEPGKEVWFLVYYNNGGAGYMGQPCPMSRKVRIVAPGTTKSFFLKEDNIRSCGAVKVSSVRGGPLPE